MSTTKSKGSVKNFTMKQTSNDPTRSVWSYNATVDGEVDSYNGSIVMNKQKSTVNIYREVNGKSRRIFASNANELSQGGNTTGAGRMIASKAKSNKSIRNILG